MTGGIHRFFNVNTGKYETRVYSGAGGGSNPEYGRSWSRMYNAVKSGTVGQASPLQGGYGMGAYSSLNSRSLFTPASVGGPVQTTPMSLSDRYAALPLSDRYAGRMKSLGMSLSDRWAFERTAEMRFEYQDLNNAIWEMKQNGLLPKSLSDRIGGPNLSDRYAARMAFKGMSLSDRAALMATGNNLNYRPFSPYPSAMFGAKSSGMTPAQFTQAGGMNFLGRARSLSLGGNYIAPSVGPKGQILYTNFGYGERFLSNGGSGLFQQLGSKHSSSLLVGGYRQGAASPLVDGYGVGANSPNSASFGRKFQAYAELTRTSGSKYSASANLAGGIAGSILSLGAFANTVANSPEGANIALGGTIGGLATGVGAGIWNKTAPSAVQAMAKAGWFPGVTPSGPKGSLMYNGQPFRPVGQVNALGAGLTAMWATAHGIQANSANPYEGLSGLSGLSGLAASFPANSIGAGIGVAAAGALGLTGFGAAALPVVGGLALAAAAYMGGSAITQKVLGGAVNNYSQETGATNPFQQYAQAQSFRDARLGGIGELFNKELNPLQKLAQPAGALIDMVSMMPALVGLPERLAGIVGGDKVYNRISENLAGRSGMFANVPLEQAYGAAIKAATSSPDLARLTDRYGGGERIATRLNKAAVMALADTGHNAGLYGADLGAYQRYGRTQIEKTRVREYALARADFETHKRNIYEQKHMYANSLGHAGKKFGVAGEVVGRGVGAVLDFFGSAGKSSALTTYNEASTNAGGEVSGGLKKLNEIRSGKPYNEARGKALYEAIEHGRQTGGSVISAGEAAARAHYARQEARYRQKEHYGNIYGLASLAQASIERATPAQPYYDYRDLTSGVPDARSDFNAFYSKMQGNRTTTQASLNAQFQTGMAAFVGERNTRIAAATPALQALASGAQSGQAGAQQYLTTTMRGLAQELSRISSASKKLTESFSASTKKLQRDFGANLNAGLSSVTYSTGQSALGVSRGNYSLARNLSMSRQSHLLTLKNAGAIRTSDFIQQSFDAKREEFFYADQSSQLQLDSDQSALDNAIAARDTAANSADFDPAEVARLDKEIGRLTPQVALRRKLLSRQREFANESLSPQEANRAVFAARSRAAERQIQPFSTAFFGTIARGGTFKQAFASLARPALQLVGSQVSRTLGRAYASFRGGTGRKSGAGMFSSVLGAGAKLAGVGSLFGGGAAAATTGASSYGTAIAGSLAKSGIQGAGFNFASGSLGHTASSTASNAASSTAGQAASGIGTSLAGLGGGVLGTIGGSILGKSVLGDRFSNTGSMIGGAVGAFAGGAIGTAIMPGVGTFIGAAIGGFVGSFGGGALGGAFSGSKGQMKKWQARQSYYAEELQPAIERALKSVDAFDYNTIQSAWKKVAKLDGKASDGMAMKRAAFDQLRVLKNAWRPYMDIAKSEGGIRGNLFKYNTEQKIRLNSYGAFSSAAPQELFGFYRDIQDEISNLKPKQRGMYRQLSQQALTSQYNFINERLGVQIDRTGQEVAFTERANTLRATDRAISEDVYNYRASTYDRDTQRQLERVMGTLQRRNNRQAIASELLDDRAFNRGIFFRQKDLEFSANGLAADQDAYQLSTAQQDYGYLVKQQENLTAEYEKLYPLIGNVSDELLRLLSVIRDLNDAMSRI